MVEVKEIGLEEARRLLESGETLFVDIRDKGSYQKKYIPGAFLLNETNTQEFVSQAEKSKTLVVYCYHGNMSMSGAAFLMDQGFQKVYSLAGGFDQWRRREKIRSNS